jgi:hypothetical protein
MKRPCVHHQLLFHCFCAVGLAVLLAACSGGGDAQEQAAPEATAVPVILTCSEMCLQQGQCGSAADGRTLILGHSDHPETQNHDLVFNADALITIQETREQMIQPINNQPYMQPFSRIVLNENGQQGWVANWCIAPSPAQ